jgi:spermidine synthase
MLTTWKIWCSYLFPLTLETSSSDLNPNLAVVLYRGRLQLLSGNAIYSWDDLYRNFRIAFEKLHIEDKPYHDALILGLGLGSIPYMLEKHFGCQYAFTAVEIDEAVADLANRYSLYRLESPIDIITADAQVFVELCDETYDLIAIDIFQDDLVPYQFETLEFLQACAALLKPGGMLLFNRLHNHDGNSAPTERFYQDVFKQVFPRSRAIDTDGNWILVGES